MPTYDKVPTERMNYGIVLNDCSAASLTAETDLCGWVFTKASHAEGIACSQQLRQFAAIGMINRPRQEMAIEQRDNGHRLVLIDNRADWRYSVVRPTAVARLSGSQLSEALRIADANLHVELWSINKLPESDGPDTSIGGNPAQCVQYLLRAPLEESLVPIDLVQMAEVVELRASLDEERYPSIVRAIEMFRSIDVNPPTSAKILAYFGVVESLLSHAPQPNDSADSITRQLKRNLTLLDNRMDAGHSLGFNEFGETKPETVISKLYNYRSAIAHGGDVATKVTALVQIHNGWDKLSEAQWPNRFLRRLTKRLLVQALREPQLVVDLKG